MHRDGWPRRDGVKLKLLVGLSSGCSASSVARVLFAKLNITVFDVFDVLSPVL